MKKKLIVGAFIASILLIIFALSGVLSSLIIGFVIAYVLDPVADFLEARHIRRPLGIALIFTVLIGVVALFYMLAAPVISRQVSAFTRKVPKYVAHLQETTIPVIRDYIRNHPEQMEEIKTKLQSAGMDMLMPVINFIKNLFSGTINVILSILDLLLIPVLAFYLLKDIDKLTARIAEAIPPRHRDQVTGLFSEIDRVIKDFLKGQLTVSMILALLYSIGLTIFAVPLGIVIGLVAGFANMIPYLGLAIGLIPALLLSWLDAHSVAHLIGVAGTFTVAQILEGTVISPRVVGQKVGLHPVTVIVAILLGGHYFGFVGILAAVPAASVINVLTRRAYNWYIQSEYYLN